MSSVFKALQQVEVERRGIAAVDNEPHRPLDLIAESVEPDDSAPAQFVSLQPPLALENRIGGMLGDNSIGAEKFRVLSTRLRRMQQERQVRKVVLTSSGPGEGKSLIAANLAVTLGRSQRVLLLEGDLRHPALGPLFGFGELKGLSDYLSGAEPLGRVVYRLEPSQLHLLPAGSAVQDPMQLLESRRLADLINDFATSFDWIIIDSPPLVPLADTTVLARLADGLLLVVRGEKTSKRLLQKAADSLNGDPLLGVVLNQFPERDQEIQPQYYQAQSVADQHKENS